MSISDAIDMIYFAECCDWELYLGNIVSEDAEKEKKELKEAYKTVRKAGIRVTGDILEKKRDRWLNKQQPPIKFIDRVPFRAIDINDLPF